jgi:predicted O-methyltransferase YrrM
MNSVGNSVDARRALLDLVETVQGWLEPDEIWALHSAALAAARRQTNPTIVEIGSWKGRSTVALALALRSTGRGTVFAIDPHTGSKEHTEILGSVDTYEDFLHSMEVMQVTPFVRPLRMTSHSARPLFDAQSVDLLFVDGSHEYEDVLQDIDDWTPTLKDGASVAFNDVWWPGVCHALLDRVLRQPSMFRNPRMAANTLVFDVDRRASWSKRDAVTILRVRLPLELRHRLRGVRRFVPDPAIWIWMRTIQRLVGSGKDNQG